MNLRAFQEEIKELVFFSEHEPVRSALWKESSIPARLGVYRHNTRSNWTDTLDYDFPLTKKQFADEAWGNLQRRYFIKHPPQHWELNTSITPFVRFLKTQKVQPYIAELADYEWNDLKIFIDRATVSPGELGHRTNPTAVIRAYQHQIFFWVDAGAPSAQSPKQKPEVLIFYRDSKNTCHIQEADPLMILLLEHFKKSGARLEDLEPIRRRMLPANKVPLQTAFETLRKNELIL